MLYVLARSLAGGKREGVLSAIGTFFGGMVHVFAAALGVSIILAKSAIAFAAVKYIGAAYLCFLGVRMILDARKDTGGAVTQNIMPQRNPLWQGVATEVLNPKTALFFLSFIPQFVVRANGHVFLQFVTLGTISVVMNTTADLIVDRAGRTTRRQDSIVSDIPAASAYGNGRHYDWAGHVSGDEREQVG